MIMIMTMIMILIGITTLQIFHIHYSIVTQVNASLKRENSGISGCKPNRDSRRIVISDSSQVDTLCSVDEITGFREGKWLGYMTSCTSCYSLRGYLYIWGRWYISSF
jgi:hypothetical protein